MTTYKTTFTEITIHSEHENPVHGVSAVHIRLCTEGDGGYITIQQDDQSIVLDPEKLPLVMEAAQRLLSQPIGEGTD
jgi:hypothetical protein